MADQSIRFRLSSHFDGEGFKASENALKANAKEIQSGVRGLGELTKAFADVSPSAAAAVGEVKSFTAAFATGGVVGGVIEVALRGISAAVEYGVSKWNEAKEAAKKYADILRNEIVTSMDEAGAKFDGLQKQMAQANKVAADLVKVMNGKAAEEAATKVFEINKRKFEQLEGVIDANERAFIEASAAREIQLVKAAEAEAKLTNAVEYHEGVVRNAAEVRNAAAARAAEADSALAAATDKVRPYVDARTMALGAVQTYETDYANGLISLQEYQQRVMVAKQNVAAVEEKYADDAKYLADATDKAAAAHEAAAQAEFALTAANTELQLAYNARKAAEQDATVKGMEADAKVNEAKERRAKEEADFSEFLAQAAAGMEEEVARRKKLNESTDKLTKAQDDAAAGMSGGGADGTGGAGAGGKGKASNVRVVNAGEIGSSFSVGIDMGGVRGDIQKPRKLDDETWGRYKDGTASVADVQRVKRFQQMDERGFKFTEMQRVRADVAKHIQLADKPDTWLSKRDRQWLSDYKSEVVPKVSEELLKEFYQSNSDNILTTMKMEKILQSDKTIEAWIEKMKLK